MVLKVASLCEPVSLSVKWGKTGECVDWMTPPARAAVEWAALGYRLKREFKKYVFKEALLAQS